MYRSLDMRFTVAEECRRQRFALGAFENASATLRRLDRGADGRDFFN